MDKKICYRCHKNIPFGKYCDGCAAERAKEENDQHGYNEDGSVNHARAIFVDGNGNITEAGIQANAEWEGEDIAERVQRELAQEAAWESTKDEVYGG